MTRIAWLSANLFGHRLLEGVLALDDPELSICGVVTLRPGAKTVMYDGVATEQWREFGLEVAYIDRIETDGADALREMRPDYVVMAGWRQIVPPEVLAIPAVGFVSFHPTKLPFGRGPAPLINQILAGVEHSAISFIHTDDGVDSGDIIGQGLFTIGPDDHTSDVYEKILTQGVAVGVEYIPLLARGTAPRTPQDPLEAHVFDKPRRANWISLDESTETTYRRIRALSRPYRGAHIEDASGNRLVVWRAAPTADPVGERVTATTDLAAFEGEPMRLYFSDGQTHLQVTDGEIRVS